jgi:hypothetical protein
MPDFVVCSLRMNRLVRIRMLAFSGMQREYILTIQRRPITFLNEKNRLTITDYSIASIESINQDIRQKSTGGFTVSMLSFRIWLQ